jgi:hypothetical protein
LIAVCSLGIREAVAVVRRIGIGALIDKPIDVLIGKAGGDVLLIIDRLDTREARISTEGIGRKKGRKEAILGDLCLAARVNTTLFAGSPCSIGLLQDSRLFSNRKEGLCLLLLLLLSDSCKEGNLLS